MPLTHLRTVDGSRIVVHPLSLQAELDDREDQDQGKQYPGIGAGQAHLVLLKSILVDALQERRGRAAGAAVGHDQHRIEHLQAVDDVDDDQQKQRRGDQRQRDGRQLPEAARAVDVRRLVAGRVDGFERRQHHQGVITRVLPHRRQHDARHRPILAVQPGGAGSHCFSPGEAAHPQAEGAGAMTGRYSGRPVLPPKAEAEILELLYANMEISSGEIAAILKKHQVYQSVSLLLIVCED